MTVRESNARMRPTRRGEVWIDISTDYADHFGKVQEDLSADYADDDVSTIRVSGWDRTQVAYMTHLLTQTVLTSFAESRRQEAGARRHGRKQGASTKDERAKAKDQRPKTQDPSALLCNLRINP